jgi:hypothetical protein
MKEKECTCPIFRALEKKGLRWNPETEEIETKRWRAKKGRNYYYINVFMEVLVNKEYFYSSDNMLWKRGNYFRTEEEAKKYAKDFSRILKEGLNMGTIR